MRAKYIKGQPSGYRHTAEFKVALVERLKGNQYAKGKNIGNQHGVAALRRWQEQQKGQA